MSDISSLISNIIKGSSKDLLEAFDRNFERKAFFDKKWPSSRNPKRGGLQQRDTLRGGLKARTSEMSIFFENAVPYAKIHNEGGELTITTKMKKYFWAKHIEAKNAKNSIEAEQFKAMALKPIGSKIIIPKRQFIGNHPKVREAIERAVNDNLATLNEGIEQILSGKR